MITAERYHDISCGHRVVGHENKCKWIHGHNYRIHFKCAVDELDNVGRVLDFGVMKSILCEWLEEQWDHKFLIWEKDPLLPTFDKLLENHHLSASLRVVPFNPTAENIASWLLTKGNQLLACTGVRVIQITVEETRKCQASASAPVVEKN